MPGKPIIAVTGATGAQGGSVAKWLLEDGSFQVRAITRKVDSPQAKGELQLNTYPDISSNFRAELASKGAEVVSADMDKPETLVEAFKGAHGVFALTNCA